MNPNSVMALRLRSECYETIAMSKPINDPEHSKYLIRALSDMKKASHALELKVRIHEERQRLSEDDRTVEPDERLEANKRVGAVNNNNDPERLSPVIEEEPADANVQENETPPGSDGESSSGVSAGSLTTTSSTPTTPPLEEVEQQNPQQEQD